MPSPQSLFDADGAKLLIESHGNNYCITRENHPELLETVVADILQDLE